MEWCEAGWDEVWVEDFDRWFRAFRGVDPGELLINYNRDRALESMRRWVDCGIVGEDLEIFDSKGYTPAEAVKLIGDGVVAKDALVTPDRDERLAEQVSCRSWSTIWKRAQALGWGIKDMTSYHDGQFYVIELRRLVDGREAEVIIEDGRFSRSYTKDGGNLQILKMRELLDTL